ncbi:hypothetical protein AB0D34_39730 [Streptomyces sp. NPDC048420]|uniref:hypothetical protein n=1 Tax=Streptomyces sp. NPDC048420 TaxID=3155755 RepID=UPI003444FAB0
MDLGKLTARAGNPRAAIDSRTGTIARIAHSGPQCQRFSAARSLTAAVKRSTASRAAGWRERIQQLQAEPVVESPGKAGRRTTSNDTAQPA